MGLRYRKNCGELPGKPDLVFFRARVAVFCDGDFWHGRDWILRKAKLEGGTNARYWIAKIASNVERDARNTAALQVAGWLVIRLWETDIRRDPTAAAELIRRALTERLAQGTGPVRVKHEAEE
jgi:DNA mismatch endonuclease (patch repair protein)